MPIKPQTEQAPFSAGSSHGRERGGPMVVDLLTEKWWARKKTLKGRTMFIKGSSLSPIEQSLVESRWRSLRRDTSATPDMPAPRGGNGAAESEDQGVSAATAFITTERELVELLSTLRITRQPLTLLACREALTISSDGSTGRLSMLDTIAVLERCKTIHAVWRHKLQGRAVDDELLEAFVAIGGEEGCETAADVGALRHVVADFDLSLDVDSALRDLRGIAKGVKGPATGINFLELASLLKPQSSSPGSKHRGSIESYDGGDDLHQKFATPQSAPLGPEDNPRVFGNLSHSGSFTDELPFDHSRRASDAAEKWGRLRAATSSGHLKLQPSRSFKGNNKRGPGGKEVTMMEGIPEVPVGEGRRRSSFKTAPSPDNKQIESAGILLSSMTYVSIDGDDFDCFDLHATAMDPKHAIRMYRSLYTTEFEDAIVDAVTWLQPPVPAQLTDYLRRVTDGNGESSNTMLATALASGPEQLRMIGATRQTDSSWYYQYCGQLLRSAAYTTIFVDFAERSENQASPPSSHVPEVSRLFTLREMRPSAQSLQPQLPPPYFSLLVMQGAGAMASNSRRRKSTIAGSLEKSPSFKGPTATKGETTKAIGAHRVGSANAQKTNSKPKHLSPISHHASPAPANPTGANTMRMFFDSVHGSPNKSRGASVGGVSISGNFDRDYKSICDRYKSKKYREKYRVWLQEFNESKSAVRPDESS